MRDADFRSIMAEYEEIRSGNASVREKRESEVYSRLPEYKELTGNGKREKEISDQVYSYMLSRKQLYIPLRKKLSLCIAMPIRSISPLSKFSV